MYKVPLVLAFLAGVLLTVGLMIFDEILTLAIYCNFCLYNFPVLGNVNLYGSEEIAWILIFSSFTLGVGAVNYYYRWLNTRST